MPGYGDAATVTGVTDGMLACPGCRRLYYERPAADVRRELVAGERFEEWLRCGRCGTPSAEFRPATDEDVRRWGMSPVIHECVIENKGN